MHIWAPEFCRQTGFHFIFLLSLVSSDRAHDLCQLTVMAASPRLLLGTRTSTNSLTQLPFLWWRFKMRSFSLVRMWAGTPWEFLKWIEKCERLWSVRQRQTRRLSKRQLSSSLHPLAPRMAGSFFSFPDISPLGFCKCIVCWTFSGDQKVHGTMF